MSAEVEELDCGWLFDQPPNVEVCALVVDVPGAQCDQAGREGEAGYGCVGTSDDWDFLLVTR